MLAFELCVSDLKVASPFICRRKHIYGSSVSGSVLSGSVLSASVLSGSVLSVSVLSGSVLSGSVLRKFEGQLCCSSGQGLI